MSRLQELQERRAPRECRLTPDRAIRSPGWLWLFPAELVEGLVAAGRLERPEPGWLSAS